MNPIKLKIYGTPYFKKEKTMVLSAFPLSDYTCQFPNQSIWLQEDIFPVDLVQVMCYSYSLMGLLYFQKSEEFQQKSETIEKEYCEDNHSVNK